MTKSKPGHDITVGDTTAAVTQLRSMALETNSADVNVNEIIIRSVRSAGHAF